MKLKSQISQHFVYCMENISREIVILGVMQHDGTLTLHSRV